MWPVVDVRSGTSCRSLQSQDGDFVIDARRGGSWDDGNLTFGSLSILSDRL